MNILKDLINITKYLFSKEVYPSIFYKIDPLFKHGIYWHGSGSDPRLINSYNPDNIKTKNNSNVLTLDNKYYQNRRYSGAMVRSDYTIDTHDEKYYQFNFTIPISKHIKTAFWLKSEIKDVDEVDIFECFNHKVFKLFGYYFVNLIFTDHKGTNYKYDHEYNPTGIWLMSKSKTINFDITFKTGNEFKWYLNDKLVKKAKNHISTPCVFIADIGLSGTPKEFNKYQFEINY